MAYIFLTSGSTWTVPADCPLIEWVDCIGSGADGTIVGTGGTGGGGGAWAHKHNVSVTPGATINIRVGAGLDTVFGGTSLASCICGAQKANGATGGAAASCVGDDALSGGDGHAGAGFVHGGGGGAASYGGAGSPGTTSVGGNSGSGAAGGAVNTDGSPGTEFGGSHGAGGGGGPSGSGGQAGGAYGGGGGGAGGGAVGAGAGGLIILTYTPTLTARMAVTEGADSFAGAAAMKDIASMAVTEGGDTFAATAVMTNIANMAATEDADRVTMSSADIAFALMAVTEDPDEFSATGTLGWSADLAATEDPDTFEGVMTAESLLTMAVSEGADSISGTAFISNSGTTPINTAAPFRGADYLDLITSEHRGKARFTSTIAASVSPTAEQQAMLAALPAAFDLDTAIGVQLDAVGAWVGISRLIQIPLINVWFSFDIVGRGWDEGIWKGPFDPETGIYALDDDTYRKLIRLKIRVNNWDGLLGSAQAAIAEFYAAEGSFPFVLDNTDMSMTACISGARPAAVMFAIFAGRYVEFKPAAVRLNTVVPSVPGTGAFGFDVENDYIGGFDSGSWPRDAEEAMIEELSA